MEAVQMLLAIEEIKQLKAKYFQHLDAKNWPALANLFTPDALVDYSRHARNLIEQHGKRDLKPAPENWVFTGGDAVVGFLSPLLANIISTHHGHDPQVTVIDATKATGLWSLYDRLESADEIYHGYGHYEEDYRLVDGHWKFSRLILTRERSAIELKTCAR